MMELLGGVKLGLLIENWTHYRGQRRYTGGRLRITANDRLGSVAVVETDSSPMTALGWKADIEAGRMSALTKTGRSKALRVPDLNGCYRPKADIENPAEAGFSNLSNVRRPWLHGRLIKYPRRSIRLRSYLIGVAMKPKLLT
jgi:hypothetical protein